MSFEISRGTAYTLIPDPDERAPKRPVPSNWKKPSLEDLQYLGGVLDSVCHVSSGTLVLNSPYRDKCEAIQGALGGLGEISDKLRAPGVNEVQWQYLLTFTREEPCLIETVVSRFMRPRNRQQLESALHRRHG